MASGAAADWLDADLAYRRRVRIQEGFFVIGDTLHDFPVLIRVAAGDPVFEHARTDGTDICFTGADGRTRLRVYRDGHYWLAKTYPEWAAETGMTARSVRSAVAKLADRGVIQKTAHRFNGLSTLHMRFDDAGFEAAWEEQELAYFEQRAPHEAEGGSE